MNPLLIHICLINTVRALKGQTIHNIHHKSRIRYSVICAITTKTIIHFHVVKGSVDGNKFIEFIQHIVNNNSKPYKQYILLDNARIHHYKPLIKYLSTINNFEFIYNVPYSPQFNPIELVFSEAKRHFNKSNLKDIHKKIHMSFKKSQSNLKQYFNHALNF